MSFFAILLALVLEQARPLPAHNLIYTSVQRWTTWTCLLYTSDAADE